MSYVLSYIRPDKTAVVMGGDPLVTIGMAIRTVVYVFMQEMTDESITLGEARRIGRDLFAAPGTEVRHEGTGLVFRIDPAESPPNVCPCCGGLVRPKDHPMAGHEDAYCLGCFTWKRGVPQCLPENTAHPVGYNPDKEN